MDVNKTVVSTKASFGKKSFKNLIGYKHLLSSSLYLFLPEISAYRKDVDETKFIFDNRWYILQKHNKIWKKDENTIDKEFDGDPVYKKKYLKAKIKSYNGKINPNFHNSKITKISSQCICWSLSLIDSVFKMGNNYYAQVFLEECKYVVKEKMTSKYIINDIDKKISREENSDEENFGENIFKILV